MATAGSHAISHHNLSYFVAYMMGQVLKLLVLGKAPDRIHWSGSDLEPWPGPAGPGRPNGSSWTISNAFTTLLLSKLRCTFVNKQKMCARLGDKLDNPLSTSQRSVNDLRDRLPLAQQQLLAFKNCNQSMKSNHAQECSVTGEVADEGRCRDIFWSNYIRRVKWEYNSFWMRSKPYVNWSSGS